MWTPNWLGCLTATRVSEQLGSQAANGLVSSVRRALQAAPAASAEARFEQAAWLALLEQHEAGLLTRGLAPAHLTASAAVLTPDARHTCLVLHHKLQLWVQPGGHFEVGDVSAAAAAAREVLEETGLAGDVLAVPALLSRHPAPCAPGIVDWHLDIQHVLVTERTPPVPSDETPKVAWWPVRELPDDLAGGIHELVDRAVAVLQAR
jgi:8-oxo-dGTP pyrophosphatase MutT (NUDIX family)